MMILFIVCLLYIDTYINIYYMFYSVIILLLYVYFLSTDEYKSCIIIIIIIVAVRKLCREVLRKTFIWCGFHRSHLQRTSTGWVDDKLFFFYLYCTRYYLKLRKSWNELIFYFILFYSIFDSKYFLNFDFYSDFYSDIDFDFDFDFDIDLETYSVYCRSFLFFVQIV